MKTKSGEIVFILREEIQNYDTRVRQDETGTILEVGGDIATVYGLDQAAHGELVELGAGVKGMVTNLARDSAGVVLLDNKAGIQEGTVVRRIGWAADVPVGNGLIGRVVDVLGRPVDGLDLIEAIETRLIEHEVSGVISREPINVPLQTSILAIGAMVPIGQGQCEPIIGSHQTGKTTITMDAILNQKGQDIICIYVAINQKAPTMTHTQDTLEKYGAIDYPIIVSFTASESALLQYIAPYSGVAMGEYFMGKGKDVLIVCNDLSKHAVAYHTLSLLLKHSPGREAYPGDAFYLHSHSLERTCRLTKEYGGGSMTALPITETQTGDVSAYIPTNVISIADSQVYLETNLSFAKQRPAVNVGLSVPRVDSVARTQATKKAVGTLHINPTRFQELKAFTQLASNLDPTIQQTLDHGRWLLELFRQPLYHLVSVNRQIIPPYVVTSGLVDDVPLEHVRPFVLGFAGEMEAEYPDVMAEIESISTLSGPTVECIRAALAGTKKRGGAT